MKDKRKTPKQQPAVKIEPLTYSDKYGQCRTQAELRDFFQKMDLVWGYKKHEQGI